MLRHLEERLRRTRSLTELARNRLAGLDVVLEGGLLLLRAGLGEVGDGRTACDKPSRRAKALLAKRITKRNIPRQCRACRLARSKERLSRTIAGKLALLTSRPKGGEIGRAHV